MTRFSDNSSDAKKLGTKTVLMRPRAHERQRTRMQGEELWGEIENWTRGEFDTGAARFCRDQEVGTAVGSYGGTSASSDVPREKLRSSLVCLVGHR